MSILFFLIFWLYIQQLPCWEMHTDHVNNAVITDYSCLASPSFDHIAYTLCSLLPTIIISHSLLYLIPYSDLQNHTLGILLSWCLFSPLFFFSLVLSIPLFGDRFPNASTLLKRVYIMSILFLLIFSDFLIIFAWITILGNVHRLCKQYTNIVDNSLCHATPFFLIFSWCSGHICINYHLQKCTQTM